MDDSFSQALNLNSMSSTTLYVVWAMIIFLIILISSTVWIFVKQTKIRDKDNKSQKSISNEGKGFSAD